MFHEHCWQNYFLIALPHNLFKKRTNNNGTTRDTNQFDLSSSAISQKKGFVVPVPKYFTTSQLAELLHVNSSTIRASRVSGVLLGYPAPLHIKLGKSKVLYRTSEIKKYEDNLIEQRLADARDLNL